jgi:hypothetical protein
MACVEGNLNHKYNEDGQCTRIGCGVRRENGSPAARGGIPTRSIAEIRAEQVEGKPSEKKATKFRQRKERETEIQKDIEHRRKRIGAIIARWPSTLQGQIAHWLYQYDGDAFELAASELDTLTACWADVLNEFEIDLDGPWVAIGALVWNQFEISMRQWERALATLPAEGQAQERSGVRVQ